MSTSRRWLCAASTVAFVLLVSACSTPEERIAKLQLRQQKVELKAQQLAQRNEARNNAKAAAVTDQRLPLENVIVALSSCDASLGATVKQFAPALGAMLPVTVKGEVATINVTDRRVAGSNSVRIGTDAKVYGLAVSGYYDESVEINGEVKKMTWGFYLPASVEQVATVLGGRVQNFKRVTKELNGNYVRMEIFDGRAWHRTSRFDHYRSQANLAGERSMVIEASRDPGFPGTRVGCSVRGLEMEQIQDSLRPELD